MTTQIISLAECPFCPDDAGGVFLDARKVMLYQKRGGTGDDMNTGPEQQINYDDAGEVDERQTTAH